MNSEDNTKCLAVRHHGTHDFPNWSKSYPGWSLDSILKTRTTHLRTNVWWLVTLILLTVMIMDKCVKISTTSTSTKMPPAIIFTVSTTFPRHHFLSSVSPSNTWPLMILINGGFRLNSPLFCTIWGKDRPSYCHGIIIKHLH